MADAFRDRMMAATRVVRSEETALKRRIAALYASCARDMGKEVAHYGADSLTGRRAQALQESMRAYVKALWQDVRGLAEDAIRKGAEIGIETQSGMLGDALHGVGITTRQSFASMFARTQDEAVASVLNGSIYAGKRAGLSRRIWNNEALLGGQIEQLIASAVAQGRGATQLARDLEAFVKPDAMMPDNWNDIYEGLPFAFHVDYNAKRLAVSALNHSYFQGAILAGRENPYAEFLHWELSRSHEIYDVCDTYMEHDEGLGKGNFALDNAPLPHPFCKCTWYIDCDKSLEEIGEELGEWLAGAENPKLERAFGEWKTTLLGVDNITGYRYHEDGTIIATDDWKTRTDHFSIPANYRPYAVIETCSGAKRQIDRTFYDANGTLKRQIHGGPHAYKATYGNGGAHAHDFEQGMRVVYSDQRHGRELTAEEVKENYDIIPHSSENSPDDL